jgi:PAS domain S-box-containing protein
VVFVRRGFAGQSRLVRRDTRSRVGRDVAAGIVGGSDGGLGSQVALLADFGIAAVATDLDGIVCECNHVAAALFGRRQSAMLGVPLGTVSLAQADGSGVGSILRGLLGVGRWRGEFEMQDANGLPLRLDVRARVVRNRGGRPIGVEAVFENLSERVEAERRASMSEARLNVAHRIAGLESWEWDPGADRLITSDSFTSLLGLAPGTVLTMADALAAMPLDDRVRVQSTIDGLRSGGSDAFSVEYRVRGADGELRSFETHCGAIRGDDGLLTRVWGIARNVNEHVHARDRLPEGGEFWQGTLDSLTDHVAVLDEHGEILAVNLAWRRFAQAEGSDCDDVGTNYLTVCQASPHPFAKAVAEGLSEILAGGREVFEVEYPWHGSSAKRWFLLRATRYYEAGQLRVVVAHEDITERRQAQEQASMQSALLDEIDVSVIVTGSDLTVLSWSAGAERLYGWTAGEAIGRSARDTVLPDNQVLPKDEEGFKLGLRRDGRWDGEYTVRRKDGSRFPAHVRSRVLSDSDGRVTGAVNVAMDITARKESERALLSARNYLAAVTDCMGEGVLTCDVAGRLMYMNQAAQDLLGWSLEELTGRGVHGTVHSRRADGSLLAVEDCPILRARRDGEVVRVEDDIFIRRDGSELAVAYTASPFSTDDGIEGCVVVFEDITERKAATQRVEHDLEKLAWLERIQKAMTEKRFVLHAQPIVDLHSNQLVQREMLLRMRPPDDASGSAELVAPSLFLPVAEEFGLITEIDRWVIDRSTEIAATGEVVQINVSARSVSDPSLVEYIRNAILRTGADPEMMVFEITETTLVSDEAAARSFVERLHLLGCKIALDDFGTGYGGFSYLKQLPVDFLKIDVEFVRDLRDSSASRSVVEAIVKLAGGFGLKTVGEGVEDQATLDLLRELGVDYGQGFYIGRPAPIDMATGRLEPGPEPR